MFEWMQGLAKDNVDTLLNYLGGPRQSRSVDDMLSQLSGPQRTNFHFNPMVRMMSGDRQPSIPSWTNYSTPRFGDTTGVGGVPSSPIAPAAGPAKPVNVPVSGGNPYDPIDHTSREGFIKTMLPYAIAAEAATGLPADIMVAINLNESGHTYPPTATNNYFGIKGKNLRTGASQIVDTWEVVNGQGVPTKAEFRTYASPEESYEDFARLLQDNARYAKALQVWSTTHDRAAFMNELKAAGYATDPNWTKQVLSIANEVSQYRPTASQSELDSWRTQFED